VRQRAEVERVVAALRDGETLVERVLRRLAAAAHLCCLGTSRDFVDGGNGSRDFGVKVGLRRDNTGEELAPLAPCLSGGRLRVALGGSGAGGAVRGRC
jgi:hypothetical protein